MGVRGDRHHRAALHGGGLQRPVGAPCLIVLVDRIDGGGEKVWAWQLDAGQEEVGKADAFDRETGTMTWQGKTMRYRVGALIREERETIEADPSVATEEGGFTLRGEDASLRGTFVAPAKPEVEFGVRRQYRIGYKRNILRSSSKAVFAEGGDVYFVVLTVQEGQSPEVRVHGEGLDATVTVGKRTIRFDGEKIVLGQ